MNSFQKADKYGVFGDGSHRVFALKKYGKIPEIRARVVTIRKAWDGSI